MEKITFLANIKKLTSKVLVSGDKETRIEVSVVGPDTVNANKLADLKPADMIRLSFDPDYVFGDE